MQECLIALRRSVLTVCVLTGAAVNGEVVFSMTHAALMELEQLRLNSYVKLYNESAPCGAVYEGRLTGCGKLLEAIWFGGQPRFPFSLHTMRSTKEQCPGTPVDTTPMMQIHPDALETEFSTATTDGSVPAEAEQNQKRIKVHLLLVAHLKNYGEVAGPAGLVLRELDLSPNDDPAALTAAKRYSRLGVFTTNSKLNAKGIHDEKVAGQVRDLFTLVEPSNFEII